MSYNLCYAWNKKTLEKKWWKLFFKAYISRHFLLESSPTHTHSMVTSFLWQVSSQNKMHHSSSHRNANSETHTQDSATYLHTTKRKWIEVGLVVLCFLRTINTFIFITMAIAMPEGAIQCSNDDREKCWKGWHSPIISFTNLYILLRERLQTTRKMYRLTVHSLT